MFKYLSFTGQSGCYAELPLSVLPAATTFTIEVKFSTTSTNNTSYNWTWGTIAGREIGNNWQDDFGFCVNNGKLCFWAEPKVTNSLTKGTGGVFSNAVVNGGKVHKVAVVSSNSAIYLYCDGELVASQSNVKAKTPTSQTILLAYDSDPNSYLQMDLYEARFWNVARTQEQIFADIDGTETGLQAWYLPSAGGLLDYSGNDYHATLYGNPAYTEIDFLPVSLTFDLRRKVNNPRYVLNPNLKAYLPFDGNATEDICGNTWTTYGNPTVSANGAISGNALQLDGNSYLKMDGGLTLGGQDFTIRGWAKMDAETTRWYPGIFACNGNKLRLIGIQSLTSGLEIGIKGSVYSINTVELTDRFHWEIDYTHSSGTWQVFINGTQVYSRSSTSLNRTTYSNVYIGSNGDSSPRFWGGSIDEFQIYDGVALHTANFTPPTAEDYAVLPTGEINFKPEVFASWLPHGEINFKPEVFMSWLPHGEINFKPEVFASWIPTGEINFKPEIFATLIGEDIICEFKADLRRKLVNTNDFNTDLKRTLVVSETFSADLRRSLTNKVNFSFDLRRKITNRVEFSVDLKRTIIAPVDFTVDLRRRVRASLTGGRMLSRVSPIYDASTFMQHFFNALGAEWEPIRQYFLTLREQKFIQTVDWGIEYLEHKYSIVPDKTLTLAERRARLGIKAFNKRPLNPAVLEKYARDVFGLEVYLDESDAGYIWIIATELTQIGYEGFMKFLVQEKPAHLALEFLLYFSEYIGYKIGDDLPKLHVGLVQVTSGVGKIKLPRPKNQHVDLYAGLAQITHGKATINLPRPKTQLINFSAGCALAVTGRIYIRSSYNALEAS